jgi:hypothetical protein
MFFVPPPPISALEEKAVFHGGFRAVTVKAVPKLDPHSAVIRDCG